jgi:hypothetical protein
VTASAKRQLGALSGLCYVLFFLVSMILPKPLGAAKLVTPWSSDSDAKTYFADSHTHRVLVATGFFQALSAIALLVFVGYVAAMVDRLEPGGPLAGVTRVTGTVAAAFLLVTASGEWVLSRSSTLKDLRVARSVQDLVFVTGAGPHIAVLGVFVGVAAAVTLRTRAMPVWLSWFGVVVSILSVLSILSLLAYFGTFFIPAGRFLGFVWFVGMSVLLLRPATPAEAAGAPRRVSATA